jgi:hypothetical protein
VTPVGRRLGPIAGPSRIETAAAIVVLGGGITLSSAKSAGRDAALENVRNLEGRLILMRQVCLEAFVRLYCWSVAGSKKADFGRARR